MRERIIMGVYRFGSWTNTRVHVPGLRQAMLAVAYALQSAVMCLLHAEVPLTASIGRNLRLPHGGHGVVIHSSSCIGDDVTIAHNVTLGAKDDGGGAPRIGDDAFLCTGAILIGPITIGEAAVVGAGAVVLQDVPPGALAVGVPARMVARDHHLCSPARGQALPCVDPVTNGPEQPRVG